MMHDQSMGFEEFAAVAGPAPPGVLLFGGDAARRLRGAQALYAASQYGTFWHIGVAGAEEGHGVDDLPIKKQATVFIEDVAALSWEERSTLMDNLWKRDKWRLIVGADAREDVMAASELHGELYFRLALMYDFDADQAVMTFAA